MIRKYVHVDAPVDRVTALFHDFEGWPQWMPGIRTVDLIERSGHKVIVKLVHRQMGQTIRQIVECRFPEAGLVQHQIKGRFRKWETRWRFQPAPKTSGTTIAMELEVQIGTLEGMFFSGLIRRAVDQMVRECARNIRRQLYIRAGETPARAGSDSEILLQVFEVNGEIEVRIGDRVIRFPSP